jgi:sarcosine oxidase, subunit beta
LAYIAIGAKVIFMDSQLRTFDIAIIGGGIIGMSCAYELSQQSNLRIALFDKANPASGTTGGSAGVICLHDMGELYAQLTLLGYARVREMQREHGFTYNTWGTLGVRYKGNFPPAPSEYEQRFGYGGTESIYAHELLSVDEVVKRYPWIQPEGIQGGIFYYNQGFIDPYELVSLYERLATATGRVQVFRNTPVLQMRKGSNAEGSEITTLVTRRGAWQVGKVINAGGPWGAKIAALAGRPLALTPQRIQVCVATAFDDGVTVAPLTSVPESVDGEGVWCRGELGGTLLFGQHHHTTTEGFTVDPDYVNRVNDESYPGAVEAVYRRYWRLPNSLFLNGWCCVYGTTEDGYPIVSRDAVVPNLYHVVGMNGHGITCHAGVSQAAATLVLRNATEIDSSHVMGHPATLDFSILAANRFEQGKAIPFKW